MGAPLSYFPPNYSAVMGVPDPWCEWRWLRVGILPRVEWVEGRTPGCPTNCSKEPAERDQKGPAGGSPRPRENRRVGKPHARQTLIPCPFSRRGPGEPYVTIRAYTAAMDDEVSLQQGETIEVIHKLLDGWWVIR